MKKIIDIVILSAVVVLPVLITALAVAGARNVRSSQRCKGIDVQVLDSAYNKFLDREDILRVINRDFGGQLNRLRDCVKISKVERVLSREGYLESGNAFFTDNGILHIEVTQKTPVLKVRDQQGTILYVEKHGEAFAVTKDWCSTLPVVNGKILLADKEWMRDLSGAVAWITGERKWKDSISGITSDEKGELIVTLYGSDEKFCIGRPVGIKDKFKRISQYLSDIDPTLPQDRRYNEINVKYNGQVVCK